MADPTVDSLELKAGTLHIHGSGFTQTTTTVYVDGSESEFEFVSASELTIPEVQPGAGIVVEKAGFKTRKKTVDEEAPKGRQSAPGATGVVNENTNATGPMTPSEPYPDGTPTATQVAPPVTREDTLTEQEKDPRTNPEGVTHVQGMPIHRGRTVVDRIETNPVEPREPYPTGNPQVDHEATRARIHPHLARDRDIEEQKQAHWQKSQQDAEGRETGARERDGSIS